MGFTEVILTCLKAGSCAHKHVVDAFHSETKKDQRKLEAKLGRVTSVPWNLSGVFFRLQMN